ncbi:MAG: efflux RND transporter periplasmic adaptor subunit [Elusimicrobia bacterium]|nr:efflux RND transporter periplasmic adaptor subunit [Elusimicrobiota bacterium]
MTEEQTSKRQKPRRRWPLIIGVGAVLAGLWGVRKYQEAKLYAKSQEESQRQANEVPQVKAYKVRRQNVSGTLKRIGTVRARAETNLQFGATGRILKFDVEKGQFVKKGASVASLDQQEAKNALAAAEMEYQKAAVKYYKDRTIDRLEFERVKTRYNQARLDTEKTVIHAPHDGYLVEKVVNVGEQVDGGTVIGKIMDKSRVSIEMDLSEDDIQHLKTGQKVEITVDAVPDFKAEGDVVSITPYLKGDTRSFNVKVNIPKNPDEVLNPGMFARCTVRRYEKANALTVPMDASAEMQEKQIRVFTVDAQNKVASKSLPILFAGDSVVEVDGIQEEELVILNPGTDLEDGATVNVIDVFDPSAQAAPQGTAEPQGPKS